MSDLVGWPVVATHRWAGLFGFVPDFMPVVGRVPGENGLWVAGGYSGHGMVLGFMCGELVANAILGRETPDLDLFDPARLLSGTAATGTTPSTALLRIHHSITQRYKGASGEPARAATQPGLDWCRSSVAPRHRPGD